MPLYSQWLIESEDQVIIIDHSILNTSYFNNAINSYDHMIIYTALNNSEKAVVLKSITQIIDDL